MERHVKLTFTKVCANRTCIMHCIVRLGHAEPRAILKRLSLAPHREHFADFAESLAVPPQTRSAQQEELYVGPPIQMVALSPSSARLQLCGSWPYNDVRVTDARMQSSC